METVRLALEAMATRFELVLHGDDAVRLRAAGEEALAEIRRLEAQLSFYQPSSQISRINAHAAAGPVRVEPRLFRLLQTARRLHLATEGAFDLTVAPLMRCWGFTGGTGCRPNPEALAEARSRTGMHLVTLDEDAFTVAFARPGVLLDLGAIGKGYAVEEAVRILVEAGVERAFLHGGTSTIHAIGTPLDKDRWNVAIPHPNADAAAPTDDDVLAIVSLEDEALSVSAVWGKAFVADGKTYGHVLDPRSGHPVDGAVLSAVAGPSATTCDALSTALLVLGCHAEELMAGLGDSIRAVVVCPKGDADGFEVMQAGIPVYENVKREGAMGKWRVYSGS